MCACVCAYVFTRECVVNVCVYVCVCVCCM